MILDWNTLIEWFASQPDLALVEALSDLGGEQRQALVTSFQTYANLTTPPKMGRMLDIIGEETGRYILLLSQGLPQLEWERLRGIAINLVLALPRFILVNTPATKRPELDEYIRTMEHTMMRPMLEQGVDPAYLLLKQAGLVR
jgi:hypothetical protein